MAASDKTDALINPINPKRRGIMKATVTITGGSTVVLIGPLMRAGAWATGSDVPGRTELKTGFIPLTGCTSVIMASTLGLDKRCGIKITPSKEASWIGVRDRLVLGDPDAAHVLYGLIYGVQPGIGGPKKDMAVLVALSNNDQAITLLSGLREASVRDGASLKVVMARDKHEYMFAQTFPAGTHAMWLYYWLAAHGIHPLQDAKAITIPPPQMVTNMRVGNMDGYCVGGPWDTRAVTDNIGFVTETTQVTQEDHPEKMLGTTVEFVQKYPNTTRALTVAMLETSKFIDVSASNRRKTAKTIAAKSYINTNMDVILNRMLGRYTNGLGKTWDDPDPMRFYRDGVVNFPYLSGGMWFLTRHERQGLLKAHPGYLTVIRQVNRVDIFKQAATATGTPLPRNDMHTAESIDGVIWDAKNPTAYADGFKLKA